MKNFLKRKARIYIWPTKMGGYFNGLIFLMFLLSIGYSNNLLLIFTLFLFGLNLTWVIQTHYHLHQLKLNSVQLSDGHALGPIDVKILWNKTPGSPWGWELSLESKETFPIRTALHSHDRSEGTITVAHRGLKHFSHLKIVSTMPFGLYRAWIYLPINLQTHVYPARLKEVPPLKIKDAHQEGDFSSHKEGPHDVWNLKTYQGEESRKISWKHYARSGELVVKEGEELVDKTVHFQLEEVESARKEYYLSVIATQMVYCTQNATTFTFIGVDKKVTSGNSKKHLHACLKELALC